MEKTKSVHPVDERLPLGKNMAYALQHVFVMVAGAVAVPLMVGGAAGVDANTLRFLVSCTLFAAGLATLLQTLGIKNFLGAKIPVIEATSFAPVSAMTAVAALALKNGDGQAGLREVAGSVLCAGLFCFLASGIWGKMLVFFPKVVTGTVVTIIGLSLFPVGIKWIAPMVKGVQEPAPSKNIILGFSTLLIIILLSKFLKGLLGNLAVLFGIVLGTILAAIMGMADFSAVSQASFFEVVQPMKFGLPIFNPSSILSFILVMLVIMTEATGNMIAVHNIAGKEIHEKTLSRGLRSSGLSTMISAVFNSYPVTPFAQNVGMVSMTGVFSRFVTATAGGILLLLAFFPQFAAVFTSIPKPVLGGAGFVMFGMVAVSGIRTLGNVEFNGNKNALIVAISIGLSLIPTAVPNFFENMPHWAASILHSGITIGCISAILLNILFNMILVPKKKEAK